MCEELWEKTRAKQFRTQSENIYNLAKNDWVNNCTNNFSKNQVEIMHKKLGL